MASPNLGQSATKRISLGRLYFSPGTETYELDCGNVVKFKTRNSTETVKHQANDIVNRVRRDDMELVHTIGHGFTVTLDEFGDEFIKLLHKSATAPSDSAVAAQAAASVSVTTPEPGRTYYLGGINLTTVVVTQNSDPRVEGVDYVLDRASGRLTVLHGGLITNSHSLACTVTSTGATLRRFATADRPTLIGAFKLFEYDQLATTIRCEHRFTGSAWINDLTEDSANSFISGDLELSVWSNYQRFER